MKNRLKGIIFWLMLLTLVAGVAELTCFVTFTHFQKKFTFFDFSKYFLNQIDVDIAFNRYRPELGWDNDYPTRFGERPRSREYDQPLMAAFGDSFTHCDEVKDAETWEERLAVLLQKNVYNFGVGGYGTDQAYLKFLSVFPKVRTPIVVLGLTTENINRIVNVYRPFYYRLTAGSSLPKPRFILSQDRLRLLPNPLRSLDDIGRLRDVYFLSRIGQNDYWFNHDRYPELKFPYLEILFNKRIWLEIMNRREGAEINDMTPRPYADLWGDAEPAGLMLKILESFASKAKEYKAIPIIMISPSRSEVIEKFEHGTSSPGEKKIFSFCQEHRIPVFDAIEVLAGRASSVREIDSFFKGHVSPKGNQIIAEAFYDFLNDPALSLKE